MPEAIEPAFKTLLRDLKRTTGFSAALRPPASATNIKRVEKLTGYQWPEALRNLYALHDGESEPSKKHVAGLFGGTRFATLAELERDWKAWAGVRKDGGMEEIDDNCLSLPAGHIREAYSNAGWIAIARDGGGNALGVDLDPGPMGTVGQVITFGRDIEKKHVLAPSLPVFVERLAELVRKKKLEEYSDDDDDPTPTLILSKEWGPVLDHPEILWPKAKTKTSHKVEFKKWLKGLSKDWKQIIENLGATSFSALSAVTELRTAAVDLAPLEMFASLRVLRLTGAVTDLGPVRHCPQLKALYTSATDLSPLVPLTELHRLSLYGLRVKDLSPLVELKKLRTLSLEKTSCTRFADIPLLRSVRVLGVSHMKCRSFAGLEQWTQLQVLDVGDTAIDDVQWLVALKSLEQLKIPSCKKLGDVAALAGLPKLKRITCDYRHFAQLKDSGRRRYSFALSGALSTAERAEYSAYATGKKNS